MTIALLLSAFLTTAELKHEYHCAAQIAYHEARGEDTYKQRSAPVVVAANRVIHEEFPDSICSVMYEQGQFTFVSNGLHKQNPHEYQAWKRSQEIAKDVLTRDIENDNVGLGGALFFQHKSLPNWNPSRLNKAITIGEHTYFTLDD